MLRVSFWKVPTGSRGTLVAMALMGAMLAGMLYVFFLPSPGRTIDVGALEDTPSRVVQVPQLDAALLQTARDDAQQARLLLEPEPLRHLLEKALDVVPTVAHALGMPAEPVPVPEVREHVQRYRGTWLWYKGRLEELSGPKAGHPVKGYSIYEATLRTAEGDPVLFAFSHPPAEQVVKGGWVRAEGFVLKMRDTTFPGTIDRAPMLVGRELQYSFDDWEPVTELDPAVLAAVRDGEFTDGRYRPGPDSDKDLDEDQAVPLWHLASYARHRYPLLDKAQWRTFPALSSRDQWDQIRRGEFARGTPMRVLGTFVRTRPGGSRPARTNPAGITTWTEVWVQVRDLGGKLVAVWIPGPIEPVTHGTPLELRCYYYRRLVYETEQGSQVLTPVFVAAGLDRFTIESHPEVRAAGIVGLILAVLLILGMWHWSRQDRRRWRAHEADMDQRRRRRREQAAAGAAPT